MYRCRPGQSASSDVTHPGVAAVSARNWSGNGRLKVTVAQPLAYTSSAPAATTPTAIRAGLARISAIKRPIAAPRREGDRSGGEAREMREPDR